MSTLTWTNNSVCKIENYYHLSHGRWKMKERELPVFFPYLSTHVDAFVVPTNIISFVVSVFLVTLLDDISLSSLSCQQHVRNVGGVWVAN